MAVKDDKPAREMSLDEWCAELPHSHRVNRELMELKDLLSRARHNVEHSARHAAGGKSRELLEQIDRALGKRVP